jgi:hypothetical protein
VPALAKAPNALPFLHLVIPFIDVGVDWIESPSSTRLSEGGQSPCNAKFDDGMQVDKVPESMYRSVPLHTFLEATPWWVSRRGRNVVWDGQSAFIERVSSSPSEEGVPSKKPSRIRPLKKKDLYAAWNAVMRTPRFVRRKLRRSISRTSSDRDATLSVLTTGEDSIGETVVWRRFMDQVSEISFKADSKRLGDDHLHDLFGEFRHYVVEKHAYSLANRFAGNDPTDVSRIRLVASIVALQYCILYRALVYLSVAVAVVRLCGRTLRE